jgi:hypothetical protein
MENFKPFLSQLMWFIESPLPAYVPEAPARALKLPTAVYWAASCFLGSLVFARWLLQVYAGQSVWVQHGVSEMFWRECKRRGHRPGRRGTSNRRQELKWIQVEKQNKDIQEQSGNLKGGAARRVLRQLEDSLPRLKRSKCGTPFGRMWETCFINRFVRLRG